jgi:cytochrome c-type biogenesis protein CcmH/NrfF
MKRKRLIVVVLLLFSLSGVTAAQNNLMRLRSWAGKYPTNKHGRVTTKFFAQPEVRQSLLKLLSRADFNLLTNEYAVETPIKEIGDYLAVKVCRQHNCDDEQAGFAINLRTGLIYVRMKNGTEVRWFGSNGDYTDLAQEVQDYLGDFAAT